MWRVQWSVCFSLPLAGTASAYVALATAMYEEQDCLRSSRMPQAENYCISESGSSQGFSRYTPVPVYLEQQALKSPHHSEVATVTSMIEDQR